MRTLIAALALCLFTPAAWGHGLEHSVARSEAVVVTITHDDGSPFAFETVEVFAPGETVPFQQGRTDALGRVAFLPDSDGDWRVRAASEDGHGIDITVAATGAPPPPADTGRLSRVVTGVSILFGIFGVIAVFRRRQAPAAS
jgi:nickel transport protein